MVTTTMNFIAWVIGTVVSLSGTVFTMFFVLKLVGVMPIFSWSWWWVISPLWMPFVFGLILLIVIGTVNVLRR